MHQEKIDFVSFIAEPLSHWRYRNKRFPARVSQPSWETLNSSFCCTSSELVRRHLPRILLYWEITNLWLITHALLRVDFFLTLRVAFFDTVFLAARLRGSGGRAAVTFISFSRAVQFHRATASLAKDSDLLTTAA